MYLVSTSWEYDVATYLCVDGPLAGRSLRWRGGRRFQRPVAVALDLDHGVLEVEYAVRRPASRSERGELAFVAAKGTPERSRGVRVLRLLQV